MIKITLDETFRTRLNGLDEQVEFCDESGRTLGYFVPAPVNGPAMYAGVESPISDEELERRRHEMGGRTLAEIWAKLGRS
jgi:hypothetical protein